MGASSRTGTTSPANPHVLLRLAPVRVRQLLSRSCVRQCPPSRWAPPRVRGPGRVPGRDRRILATCQVPPSAGRHGRISTIPRPHHPRSRSCRCRAAIPVQSGNADRFARAHVVSQGVAVRMADWASARHHRAVSGRRSRTSAATPRRGAAVELEPGPARRAPGARQPPSSPAAGGEAHVIGASGPASQASS